MKEQFSLYTDCVNFPLDRPCRYQKNDNMQCRNCQNYIKISNRNNKTDIEILIIKLGAMGDVLRTTFLLNGLKEKYPKSRISWIVLQKNAQVLINNTLIDEIIVSDGQISNFLINHFFDITINLDLSPESLSLAKLANTAKTIGFSLDNNRNIAVSNKYANDWLKMSAYDSLKKANTHTYQFWMSKITELPQDNYEICVPLQKAMQEKAANFLKSLNIKTRNKIIGINPGASNRWKLKKWNTDSFIEIAKFLSNKGHTVLLLGAKEDEKEIDDRHSFL